ncbi:hypothetical protein CLLI_20230 [Clostridium liquoris]|jgi:hypothetical protein|uniref:TM2 domain protein n=1 Tax=Clostridium liquoris TaxID=1289519 RepID=A0A2T0B2C6_9CLOT|nr:hypothetical protein [Clostridium liquoris]PRR78016.1 hypothetical protein CLLI_20230 [Clostridium liquoris]
MNNRRSGFLTFLAALIPGVGYMYLGLMRKGLEALLIYMLLEPVFRLLGLGFIGSILRTILWFYTFIDTFNIARRMDMGETIFDSDLFISKILDREKANYNGNFAGKNYSGNVDKKIWITIAWALIIIGSLSIINKLFVGNEIYYIVKSAINKYFFPIVFICSGVYLLVKKK